ncbi:DNA mismatch repair protein MutS [Photobacterium aphoticum]|uniref:DNA mismatch repair protein MutS n=1 Tax=Photobacterium aphoticum TaxID=754436 RepID=A0A090R2C4_9GAMM|nr:DNA mismatch repair protein MutS [Photobacterium aphoticum]
MNERHDNLIAAIYQHGDAFGYATLDITSGRFMLTEPDTEEAMQAELQRTSRQNCCTRKILPCQACCNTSKAAVVVRYGNLI